MKGWTLTHPPDRLNISPTPHKPIAWQTMLGILTSVLCVSHVPIARLKSLSGLHDTLAASATVRGAVDSDETVYVTFGGEPSLLATRLCPHAGDNGVNPPTPTATYFDRRAYWMSCSSASEVSSANFADFNTHVTLTDEAIEFCTPSVAGAKTIIASAECTDISTCVFVAKSGSRDVRFRVSPTLKHHHLPPDFVVGSDMEFGHGATPLIVRTQSFNSYLEHPSSQTEILIIALQHANGFLHSNGTHFSVWSVESVDTVANLFTMAMMLLGAIAFVPSSVEITNQILCNGEAGLEWATSEIGNERSLMHAIMIDFATSAACICAYLLYANGVGNGTFKSNASEEITTIGDILIVACTATAATSVVWCVLRCHTACAPDSPHAHILGQFFPQGMPPVTIDVVVVARIGYEYAIVVAFMASCPLRMGSGFVQCVYILSSSVLLIAIGRDAGILCRMGKWQNSCAANAAVVLLTLFASFPLALYGVKPVVVAARSFASTPVVTWSVTSAITASLLCGGATSLNGRMQRAATGPSCKEG